MTNYQKALEVKLYHGMMARYAAGYKDTKTMRVHHAFKEFGGVTIVTELVTMYREAHRPR